jgi:hypothetical protein
MFCLPLLRIHALFVGVWLLFDGGAVALAESVTLTPVADTSMFAIAPLNNMGAVQSLAAGNTARDETFRALVKFDVSSAIPVGATITSAGLFLTVVRAPAGAKPAEFALHRMLVDWGEGNKGAGELTGAGEPATEGEANWSFRFHSTASWSDPGGVVGVDYATTASALAPQSLSEPVNFASSAMLIADVQSWLNTPGTNFGWMIKEHSESGTLTARRLGSREHPTDPPRLSIDYTLPFRIGRVEVRGSDVCLLFTAQAGKAYVVERRTSVDAGMWTTVTNLPVAEVTGDVAICEPISGGNQFYRVGEQ